MLGHKDVKTTLRIYAKGNVQTLTETLSKLDY